MSEQRYKAVRASVSSATLSLCPSTMITVPARVAASTAPELWRYRSGRRDVPRPHQWLSKGLAVIANGPTLTEVATDWSVILGGFNVFPRDDPNCREKRLSR